MNKIYFFILSIIIFLGCSRKNQRNSNELINLKNLSTEILTMGKLTYNKSCFSCHNHGLSGAAKLTDFDYWNKIADKGIDTVFNNVKKGYIGERGIMPPKGNCFTCSDKELQASIFYIFKRININKSIKKNT